MEIDEKGTSVYCILTFISIVVILFLLLNIQSNLNPPVGSSINVGQVLYDILLIVIMVGIIIAINYLHKKSKSREKKNE